MSFNRFRPKSHFLAPHSWSNDPCGAVYIPELQQYIICYQWNPGTTEGGNCAWGMAKSSDLVTWEDCAPAIQNGPSYDSLGVFSGSIVSRLVDGERILFLYYTSVSALPIHWSKPYIHGCETQSVAISRDLGASWHRYENNPLLETAPKKDATTGWRDPFVSKWPSLSKLIDTSAETDYMMIASGERGHGPQLHLYRSDNLCDWQHLSIILNAKSGTKIAEESPLRFGVNFECASFFSADKYDYIIVGVEEPESSQRHCHRYTVWLCGNLSLDEAGEPRFNIKGHGLLDHGISYAPHIFRDAHGRLLQLGWADEAAEKHVVKDQNWAGCLVHPRELFEVSKPLQPDLSEACHEWTEDEDSGQMTTLGIRPAPQVTALRGTGNSLSYQEFHGIRSNNFEVEASFSNLTGQEVFVFNVREAPGSVEVTKLVIDLSNNQILIDRSRSSLSNLGETTLDVGSFRLLPGEDLQLRLFVDVSIVEVYANDRFALTSRIYPTLDTAVGTSAHLGNFALKNVEFRCWTGLKDAWPSRTSTPHQVEDMKDGVELEPGLEHVELRSSGFLVENMA